MTESPLLTVALPTCNGEQHLRDALRGILNQSDADFDLVVSDDRSDDTTLAIIRDLAGDRARVEVNSERLGLAGNWNQCVALSHTPLVAIFHQDDVMRPGHLAAHVAAYQANPHLGLIASAADVIDHDGRDVPDSIVGRGGCGPENRTFAPGQFISELAVANPLRCSGVTIERACHQAVGGFDPSYRYVVDWEFWARASRTFAVAWLAQPSVAIRWHTASETHRFRTGTADLDETARLLDILHAEIGTGSPGLRRDANRRLARAYLHRAYTASKAGNRPLTRLCLTRALRLDLGQISTIARDPRLAARLLLSSITPGPPNRQKS